MSCGFCESALPNCVGTLLADLVAKPLKREFDYLRHFNDNGQQLRGKKNELAMARDRLQNEIEEAENQLQEIERDVQALLSKADQILTDAVTMEQEFERSFGWCPNWWWRYRLSKKLEKEKLVLWCKPSGIQAIRPD
ncbi:hypothetical protein PTKIN_Ptkin14bG0155700 [Pterospermum kingtungense]